MWRTSILTIRSRASVNWQSQSRLSSTSSPIATWSSSTLFMTISLSRMLSGMWSSTSQTKMSTTVFPKTRFLSSCWRRTLRTRETSMENSPKSLWAISILYIDSIKGWFLDLEWGLLGRLHGCRRDSDQASSSYLQLLWLWYSYSCLHLELFGGLLLVYCCRTDHWVLVSSILPSWLWPTWRRSMRIQDCWLVSMKPKRRAVSLLKYGDQSSRRSLVVGWSPKWCRIVW